MIIEHLTKMANLLDTTGSPAAKQAAEGIDAVLYSMAADDPLGELNGLLNDFTSGLQGLEGRLDNPKLQNVLEKLTGQVGRLSSYLDSQSEPEDSLESRHPLIGDEDGDETGKSEESSLGLELNENDIPTVVQPEIQLEIPTGTYHRDPETTRQEFRRKPQPPPAPLAEEGHPLEDWQFQNRSSQERDPRLFRDPYDNKDGKQAHLALSRLSKVADLLDTEGQVEAANILDTIIKDAAELPNYPSRMETRQELYDAPKHNRETMWEVTKKEVALNRKDHHLETMQPKADTLSTRYSPELPGVQALRVADGVYQDYLTKEIYDFNNGWTGRDGRRYPGGSLKNQTPNLTQYANPSRLFDSRVQVNKGN